MENDNEVYERIRREMDRLDEFNEDDAREAAWHNKRFLIKRVLADNLDVLEKEVKDVNIDEEEDEEDEDIDAETFKQYPPHYLW